MREIVNSTFVTLDGVVEKPETWPPTRSFGEVGNRMQAELIGSCSAAVMGRRTYESFAAVWPDLSGNDVADQLNAMPKYVASRTLVDPTWNNTHVIDGDLVTEVRKLKEEAGGDILQYGFGPVSHTLMAAGLLDRLQLWLHPFFLGRGGPESLIFRAGPVTELDLDEVTTLDSGIVILDYRIRRDG